MKQHNIFGGIDNIDSTGEIIKEKTTMNNTNNLFCYTAAIGFILDQADKITGSKIYFQKVKQYGNRFLKEIEKHENEFANYVDADVMSESYQIFENILSFSLDLDTDKKEEFESKLNKLINEFKQKNK